MKIYTSIQEISGDSAVALGFFDGIHLAHQEVIKIVTQLNQNKNSFIPTVLTFKVDNDSIQNKGRMKTILTDSQKIELFEQMGVCQLVMPKFSEISNYSPEFFFEEILIKKMHAKLISCGYDYTFGNKAMGDVNLLKRLCEKHNVELVVIKKQLKNDLLLSSSKIKLSIEAGDVETVNDLLGYRYYINTPVITGNRLGNKLGYPTINQSLLDTQVIFKYGVYMTVTTINGIAYKSITNVGVKPTIKGERKPLAETYIIGFNDDLYGKKVKVEFIKMLRDEKRFSSIDELKKQIQDDVNTRMKYNQ